jgi:hypothetical protein
VSTLLSKKLVVIQWYLNIGVLLVITSHSADSLLINFRKKTLGDLDNFFCHEPWESYSEIRRQQETR